MSKNIQKGHSWIQREIQELKEKGADLIARKTELEAELEKTEQRIESLQDILKQLGVEPNGEQE